MELILKKAEKCKEVEILNRSYVFLTIPLQTKETHVFKDATNLSIQMHLIIHSLNQVLLVIYSCSNMRTASSLLYLRASLIVVGP